MITIDGSIGEGGGQILRTALGLSLVTGKPFRIEKIRAGRRKPGLLRQHLTAVEAAIQVGQAKASGNIIGSQELLFEPGQVTPGEYHFSIGTAGSATLVLQTVLPSLLTVHKASKLIIEGGTHNPYAPPFDFLNAVFIPILNQMGVTVDMTLHRFGFYPAGGGKIEININPSARLDPIDLLERGCLVHVQAKALVARLSKEIALRELDVIKKELLCKEEDLEWVEVKDSSGPGNTVIIEVRSEKVTEAFVGFGELGKSAETVAREATDMVKKYLQSNVPVGKFLADQLLIPLALAKGGSFKTLAPSQHTMTNIEIIRLFLDTDIQVKQCDDQQFLVSVLS